MMWMDVFFNLNLTEILLRTEFSIYKKGFSIGYKHIS